MSVSTCMKNEKYVATAALLVIITLATYTISFVMLGLGISDNSIAGYVVFGIAFGVGVFLCALTGCYIWAATGDKSSDEHDIEIVAEDGLDEVAINSDAEN